MQQCDTLLTAEYIVTQNDSREILENGALAISGDSIVAIGPAEKIVAQWQANSTRKLGRKLLIPGLVNAHTHAAMSIFRGLADDLALMDWLQNHIWPVERHLNKEVVHLGGLLACAEMMASGTTCFCDMYLHERQIAEAADKSGIRAIVSEGVIRQPTLTYATMEEGWDLMRQMDADYRTHPRIRTSIMCHAVYTTTIEMLEKSLSLSEELGVPWMIHAAESPQETAMSLEMHGKRPIDHLHAHGALQSRTTLFHGVDLEDREIEILAATGTSIVNNPESNMKLGNGIARIVDLRKAGVNIALGTDGAASNNDLNLFTEMTTAAMAQKAATHNPSALDAQYVLDMATIGGAKALCWQELGQLAVGSKADIVAIGLDAPHMMPMYNPISQLVYAANGSEVEMVMVGGEVMFESGRFANIDMTALVREIENIKQWVLSKKTAPQA